MHKLTLEAGGCEVELEVLLAVELAVLLDEAAALQVEAAGRVLADEVRGAEDLADGANERAQDQRVAGAASGSAGCEPAES